MPWLPFYASSDDIELLRDHLNASDELAFIVSAGQGKWVAVRQLEALAPGRYCLWHVQSGALPYLQRQVEPDSTIDDPFGGWTEIRRGAGATTPYFGPGHPGIFWLNYRGETSRHGQIVLGLSSFEWIGNHYRVIGDGALPATAAVWKRLRRWVMKSAQKVPRGGPSERTPPEIWAFQGAQRAFAGGAVGGNN